jgi:hypothetical protein
VSFSFVAWFKKWNRRIHYHLGLFTLLFLWIFALSGLCLNHENWFKPHPNWTEFTRDFRVPESADFLTTARAIVDQIDMSGEIIAPLGRMPEDHFRFRLLRYNSLSTVDANLATAKVRVRTNHWGFLRSLTNLHTLTGVRRVWGERQPTRDWIMTRIWSISIDAVAGALIVLVLTSIYMWYQLKPKHTWGLVALVLGILVCGFFLWGHALLPRL